jgi:Antitoxin Phd_YefM, type II toxin-antitoxin system
MKTYTFTEARQRLADLLVDAREADVIITRRNGERFVVRRQGAVTSPLDVPGITTKATLSDILDAVDRSRKPR